MNLQWFLSLFFCAKISKFPFLFILGKYHYCMNLVEKYKYQDKRLKLKYPIILIIKARALAWLGVLRIRR